MKDETLMGEPLWGHMGSNSFLQGIPTHKIHSIVDIPDSFFGERETERKDLVLQRNLDPARSFWNSSSSHASRGPLENTHWLIFLVNFSLR